MQQDIFSQMNGGTQTKKELAIRTQDKQALSRRQKEFNRLVKKLESMRRELELTVAMLNDSLAYYGAHIHPLEEQLVVLRSTGVKIFFTYYKDKKLFSKKDKNVLVAIITSGIDEILRLSANKEMDDELKAIFKDISGMSFDELKKQGFNEMRDEMADMFDKMGFDIDLDSINGSMSDEELIGKMKEMREEFARQSEEKDEKKASRKKTKKQLEREAKEKEVEDARKKNISAIYKQLAKAFHPDLEKDEAIKVQKEELMKQLTVAYENNDLLTLLKLEIAWIQKEENNPDQLGDDKLGIYNQVLKEQVQEVQAEMYDIIEHPRYAPLHRFAQDPKGLNVKQLERDRAHLKEIVLSLEDTEVELKSKDAVKHIKDIIKMYKEQQMEARGQEEEWEEMLGEMMRMRK